MKHTPEEKAAYFMDKFNNDVYACIRVCDALIDKDLIGVKDYQNYYRKVKEILTKLK